MLLWEKVDNLLFSAEPKNSIKLKKFKKKGN